MIRKRTNDRSTNRKQPSSLWKNCNNLLALKQIHATLIIKGFNSNRAALRELIFAGAMTISGAINYAHQVFAQITEPDIFMWNTMMRGSSQSKNPSKVVFLYTEMENRGVKPDKFTFSFLLKGCTRLEWRKTGFCVHGKVLKYGFEVNSFVRNTLIYFHSNCGDLVIARSIFYDLPERSVVSWSALTAGVCEWDGAEEVRKLMDDGGVRKEAGRSLIEADDRAVMQFLFDPKPKLNSRGQVS
ncbi:hypothetical protein D5086_030650 [Populus alba]|uniref:Uncharacterized protein n=1 Tax=Populus alba TaxID=43335 RepID=A0ACC4AP23_POPAL